MAQRTGRRRKGLVSSTPPAFRALVIQVIRRAREKEMPYYCGLHEKVLDMFRPLHDLCLVEQPLEDTRKLSKKGGNHREGVKKSQCAWGMTRFACISPPESSDFQFESAIGSFGNGKILLRKYFFILKIQIAVFHQEFLKRFLYFTILV